MLIGVTGKSCSGKNHVCRTLSSKGFEVWDLDREAEKIRKEQSSEILEKFGTTDKAELAAIVFSNPEKRQELENIIYPRLIQKIKDYKYDLVINGATLYRSKLDELCSFIIYVDASFETRLDRAKKRDNVTEEAFAKRDSAGSDIDYRDVDYRCNVYVLNNESAKESAIIEGLDKIFQSHLQ